MTLSVRADSGREYPRCFLEATADPGQAADAARAPRQHGDRVELSHRKAASTSLLA